MFKFLTWSPQVFTLFGVPVRCHVSFLAFLIGWLLISPSTFGFLIIITLSILPHEFGHILAARYFNIKCRSIIVNPLGGLAFLEEVPTNWWKELWITLWGPLVSLILAMWLLLIGLLLKDWTMWVLYASAMNAGLFLFNMLPIFPMDGGRIMRSLMHIFMPHGQATFYAARTSQAFAAVLAVIGLLTGNFIMVITLSMVVLLAEAELRRTKEPTIRLHHDEEFLRDLRDS